MTAPYVVRPVRAHEWPEIKALRLAALSDAAAPIAFLQSYEVAAAWPDEVWQDRVRSSSLDAGEDAPRRQFVAVTGDGAWIGSALALVERAGDVAFDGAVADRTGGHVVGVYVAPDHRGRDVPAGLFEAAADWLRERGLTRMRLFVHVENARARGAYEKAGFRDTGTRVQTHAGTEMEMAAPLTADDRGSR
jgi:ribosomal protein S18 acetylase RimI-like enzyme